MSIFDEVLEDGQFQEKAFGPHEGFAGVLLASTACDGHIADEEVQGLFTILTRMRLYQHVTPNTFNSMFDRLLGLLKRQGPEALVDKCAPAVPPELRETAFINACDIVLADGVLEPDEKEFIGSLMTKLEVSEARAKDIAKVMIYKNQG